MVIELGFTLLFKSLEVVRLFLKLQSISFASLSPSLFETCNCSYLWNSLYGVVHRHSSSARMNLMFAVSHHIGVDTVLQNHRFCVLKV